MMNPSWSPGAKIGYALMHFVLYTALMVSLAVWVVNPAAEWFVNQLSPTGLVILLSVGGIAGAVWLFLFFRIAVRTKKLGFLAKWYGILALVAIALLAVTESGIL